MDIGEALELLDKQKKLYLKYRTLFNKAKDKRIRMRSLVVAKQKMIDRREKKIKELEEKLENAVFGEESAKIIQKLEAKNKRLSDQNEDLNKRLREEVLSKNGRAPVEFEAKSNINKFLTGRL